jgi:teichoic acid D-alanine hydrolase
MLCLLVVALISINLSACQNNSVKASNASTNSQQSPSINKNISNEELLQKKINDYLVNNNLSGSVFVGRNNQVLFNGAVGYANMEKKLLNQTSTTYPIASITKIFVATSIMQLQEKHKLNIQDPVSKYIPDFPNGTNIKLYNLLTHTSGLQTPHWNKSDFSPLSLVKEIESENMRLKFPPGTEWDYEDVNYMVLGYILEKTTGTTLYNYIQKNIISKIQLKQTGFMTPARPEPYTSISYLSTGKKVQRTQVQNIYRLYACSDIYSTTTDIAKFDKALMNGQLVSKDSLKQMLTPSSKSKYGLGLYIISDRAWSNGFMFGWVSTHSYFKDNTQIVVLTNVKNKNINVDKITSDIYELVKKSYKG